MTNKCCAPVVLSWLPHLVAIMVVGAALVCLPGAFGQTAGKDPPSSVTADGGQPEYPVLSTLRRSHPRLLVEPADIDRARRAVKEDPLARRWFEELRTRATDLFVRPTLENPEEQKRAPTGVTNAAIDRIYTLCTVFLIEGDPRIMERARAELLAVSRLAWSPESLLNNAEIAHVVAVGYDWLYEHLGTDRAVVRAALYEKALKPSLEGYVTGRRWAASPWNHGLIANTGYVLSALAIAEDEPAVAAFVIERATRDARKLMAVYHNDGGIADGPHFWHYGVSYNVYLVAGLRTALGHDFGLSDLPGFSRTGDYMVHLQGPNEYPFNFGEQGDRVELLNEIFWLARHFDRPLWSWHRRNQPKGPCHGLDVLWFDPRGKGPKADATPLDELFHDAGVATFRSAWEDPSAMFLGFKAGSNSSRFFNLDLGDFILEAAGKRWAVELGRDDISLPGYFSNRPSYYRVSTAGQNTLVVDGQNQPRIAKAPFVAFDSRPARAHAVADLTAAYPPARRVWRGVALLDRKRVLIQDEFESAESAAVVWGMHTRADVSAQGALAMLSLQDTKLRARIVSPEGASFEVVIPSVPAEQKLRPGTKKLQVVLPDKTKNVRIAVVFDSPTDSQPPPVIEPLSRWARGSAAATRR